MPIDILTSALVNGPDSIAGWPYIKKFGPVLVLLAATKYYFRGSSNTWERDLHGKVFLVTGGTSGLGSATVQELAKRGAQIILLVRSIEDSWVAEFIDDTRDATNNFMIYAEECDLDSLYSVRKFATKWLDNQPPRRVDGVICCAAEALPIAKPRQITEDGVEAHMGVNYLAHYHLITLLSPALRNQPPDRDVRVIFAGCASQSLGKVDLEDLLWENKRYPQNRPWHVYGTSKLLLGLFAKEYQRRCNDYERKDKAPSNLKVILVNPGVLRTPSTRRAISMGSVWGLLFYLLFYPIWWLILKSPMQGSQSLLFALYAPVFKNSDGGQYVQECRIASPGRKEFYDAELQEQIFDKTAQLLERIEKQSAIERKKQEPAKTKEQKLQELKHKKLQEIRNKQNITEKPKSPEELEQKLNYLRQALHQDLPLFPEKK